MAGAPSCRLAAYPEPGRALPAVDAELDGARQQAEPVPAEPEPLAARPGAHLFQVPQLNGASRGRGRALYGRHIRPDQRTPPLPRCCSHRFLPS
jgi:hypothetical protein